MFVVIIILTVILCEKNVNYHFQMSQHVYWENSCFLKRNIFNKIQNLCKDNFFMQLTLKG